MITIGIAGGVASGKSVVSARLAELGADLIDGDRLGHAVLEQPEVIAAARERWGQEVVAADGKIVRAAVADRVFAKGQDAAKELRFWEQCTHPRITQLLKNRLAELTEKGNASGEEIVVVLDAPVMFKAGWDKLCDHFVFIDTPREMRLERALTRKDWDEQQFQDREASQLKIEEKMKRSSVVIDNSGSLTKTYEQVQRFWESLFG